MNKITVGYVVQNFDDNGKCVSQSFIASDEQTWENQYGESVDAPDNAENFSLEMIQPGMKSVPDIKVEDIRHWLEACGLDQEDIDSITYDVQENDSSNICNEGIEGQISYICSRLGGPEGFKKHICYNYGIKDDESGLIRCDHCNRWSFKSTCTIIGEKAFCDYTDCQTFAEESSK
jgi:hypothetical protein